MSNTDITQQSDEDLDQLVALGSHDANRERTRRKHVRRVASIMFHSGSDAPAAARIVAADEHISVESVLNDWAIEQLVDVATRPLERQRFEIYLRGAAGSLYALRGHLQHDIAQVGKVLEDLTGYRQEYVRQRLEDLKLGVNAATDELGGSALESSCMPLRIVVKRVH